MNYNNSQSVLLSMVNIALDATGYGIVNSLDSTPIVQTVISHMDNIKRRLLLNSGLGWTWNTKDLSTVADINGEYHINGTVLNVISDNPNLVVRKGVLYDVKKNSTTDIVYTYLEAVMMLDYEDLPPLAQDYIAYMAAYRIAIGDAASQQEKNEAYQNAELVLTQLNTDEICRMSYEDDSQYLMNINDYSYFTRRMNNRKL